MARLFLLLLLSPLLVAIAYCRDERLCGNQLRSVAMAPDGVHAAIVFRRDCGATTGFSTQVSLVGPGALPSDSGNLLILDDEPAVAVRWLGPDRLLISYRQGGPPFLQEHEWDGVRILYRVQKGTDRATNRSHPGGSRDP
jgi:hypothetical protein